MSGGSARDDETALAGDADSGLDALLQRAEQVGDQVLGRPLPRAGQTVGDKYRIEECLGRGGMGAVFRATHLVSEKSVALKYMLRSTSDDHARRRFLREARMAGRIDHPNVVNVYDVAEDGDCAYLVMELLRGEPLRARFERGPLSVNDLVDVLLPAMRGVAAVHQAGVIHRDLKPDNVFLCKGPDGTPREAKVLDFGISAMSACDPNDPTLTKDGVVLGTPAYMSPEQVQSARDVDARSDVYSFGVILYKGLTGTLPFESPSYNSLILAIVHAEPKAPIELRPELPRELSAIVLRALAKQREARFASVEDLIEALLPYTTRSSAVPGMRPVTSSLPRRARWSAWALGGCVLVVLLLAAWRNLTGEPSQARPAPVATAAKLQVPVPSVAPILSPPAEPSALASAAAQHTGPAVASASLVREPKVAPRKHKTQAVPVVAPSNTAAPPLRSGKISVDDL